MFPPLTFWVVALPAKSELNCTVHQPPFKTLKEYDAINITLGLPFLRVSPDHGPNEKMIYKNLSNPLSLIKAIKFLDKKWLKLKKA